MECLFLSPWLFIAIPSVLAHGRHVVDLTHSIQPESDYRPPDDALGQFTMSVKTMGHNAGGTWLAPTMLWLSQHGGTHMDSPSHVDPGGKTVDQVSLERLMGTAVVIDLSLSARLDPDTQLQIPDVTGWEAWNGQIPDNSILAVNTGWSRYWPNATRILGTSNHSDPSGFHYPGIHPNTASWLVDNRPQVVAIAIDTPSVDFGQNKNYSVHRIFAKASVSVLQNVANLDQLPPSGCKILAIPMKLQGGSGAPLRIFAILHEHREKQRDHFHLTTDLRNCHSAYVDISTASQLLVDKRYLSLTMAMLFLSYKIS